MVKCCQFGVLLSLGVLPVFALAGCGSEDAAGSQTSAATAQQACLETHTDHGLCNFAGVPRQVCGASRLEVVAGLQAGRILSLPAAEFGLSFDFDLVTVRLTDHVGGYVELKQVASASSCGNQAGWFLDNTKKVHLCNCDSTASVGGAVWIDVLVGCATSTTPAPSADAGVVNQDTDHGQGTFTGGTEIPVLVQGTVDGGVTGGSGGCATGQCGSTCATGQCGSTCATGQCGSTCATGQCGGGIQVGGGLGAGIGGGIQVGGSIQIGGGVSAGGTVSAGGGAAVAGGAGANGAVAANGGAGANGAVAANGGAGANGAVAANGGAAASGGAVASGNASASGSISASGSVSLSGSAQASGCTSLWNILFAVNGCSR